MLKKWDELPAFMKCEEIKVYYDVLADKKLSLLMKRIFDVVTSCILLLILLLPMIVIAFLIKIDSAGPVIYSQERVTAYGKIFKIHKFRTMVNNAEQIGPAVAVAHDMRITKIGKKLRDLRIDELPQLWDVLVGNMSFVGTRPEAVKYVKAYSKEMLATLLLPAGITSEACIRYKDEGQLLEKVDDVDQYYVREILPAKMKYNLLSIKKFGLRAELKIMFKTVAAVFG